MSLLKYFPLGWMFCNNLINKMRERSLRISSKDQKSNYHNLLETHNELTIHERNLQVLMTEIYKIVKGLSPPVMDSLFEFWSNKYIIRNLQVLSTDFRRTVNYGIETITYRAPSLWAKLPSKYKFQISLKNLKWKLRNGNLTHVPVDYAKNFDQILGLLIRNMVSKIWIFFVLVQFFK